MTVCNLILVMKPTRPTRRVNRFFFLTHCFYCVETEKTHLKPPELVCGCVRECMLGTKAERAKSASIKTELVHLAETETA